MKTQISNNDGTQIGASLPPRNGSALPDPKQMTPEYLADLALQKYACACSMDCSKELHEWAMALKAELLRRVTDAAKDKARLHWLHDCSTGQTDAQGCEWGIYRVKWENGRAVEVWQTNSDFSDLDAEMAQNESSSPATPGSAAPSAK